MRLELAGTVEDLPTDLGYQTAVGPRVYVSQRTLERAGPAGVRQPGALRGLPAAARPGGARPHRGALRLDLPRHPGPLHARRGAGAPPVQRRALPGPLPRAGRPGRPPPGRDRRGQRDPRLHPGEAPRRGRAALHRRRPVDRLHRLPAPGGGPGPAGLGAGRGARGVRAAMAADAAGGRAPGAGHHPLLAHVGVGGAGHRRLGRRDLRADPPPAGARRAAAAGAAPGLRAPASPPGPAAPGRLRRAGRQRGPAVRPGGAGARDGPGLRRSAARHRRAARRHRGGC